MLGLLPPPSLLPRLPSFTAPGDLPSIGGAGGGSALGDLSSIGGAGGGSAVPSTSANDDLSWELYGGRPTSHSREAREENH